MTRAGGRRFRIDAMVLASLAAGGATTAGAQPQETRLTASNAAAGDHFGDEIDLAGNRLVVGAPTSGSNVGRVYLFERDDTTPGGTWSEVVQLVASDAHAGALFGKSVAVDKNTILVGSYGWGGQAHGSAYVFQRSPAGLGWVQVRQLFASDHQDGFWFGRACDLEGDVAVVGAPFFANQARGAVYVYERNAGGPNQWLQTARLVAPDGDPVDWFGGDVAISGDTIIVGAPLTDDVCDPNAAGGEGDPNCNSGSAYVFRRDGGAWALVRKLTAPDGEPGDRFGWSVDLAGDRAIVGADMSSGLGFAEGGGPGRAYVFERDAGGASQWGLLDSLEAADGADGDAFGSSVSIEGDVAVVGAVGHDGGATLGGAVDSGSAYVFQQGPAVGWTQTAELTGSFTSAGDAFGRAVRIRDGLMAVSAPRDDVNRLEDAGSVSLFTGPITPPGSIDLDGDGVVDAREALAFLESVLNVGN